MHTLNKNHKNCSSVNIEFKSDLLNESSRSSLSFHIVESSNLTQKQAEINIWENKKGLIYFVIFIIINFLIN